MSAVHKKAVKLTHSLTRSLTHSRSLTYSRKVLIDLIQAIPSESPTAKARVFEFPEHIVLISFTMLKPSSLKKFKMSMFVI